jgi:ABC-type transport system involved in multi-copper enzyme maturation permease subunit
MTINPVALREFRERFRSLRSPLLIGVWVLAAGMLTFLAYLTARDSASQALDAFGGFGSVLASSSMGRFVLQMLLFGLLTAVVFVVPGQAAVTIVGERERQTLPLLQVSQMSASRIIIGKLVSSLAFILLLLLTVTPLLVIPVLLGGVSIAQVFAGVGMVAAAAVTIGALSMWVSARARSVQGAVLGAYIAALTLVFGTLALMVGEVILAEPDDMGRTRYVNSIPRDDGREIYSAWLNPYIGLVDASGDILTFSQDYVTSPYDPLERVLLRRQGFTSSGFNVATSTSGPVFDGGFGGRPLPSIPDQSSVTASPIRGDVWWRTLVFEAMLTAVALLAAARLIRVPRKRLRFTRPRGANGDA